MTRARALLFSFLIAVQLFFVVLSVYAYRTRPQGLIASDGKGYYAWVRSLALDGDVDFRNDFLLLYPPDPIPEGPFTPQGRLINKYPVGVGLVELPGFAVGHAIALVSGQRADGLSAPYQFAVTIWLQLLCLVALAALWAAIVRLGADPIIAALAVASALVATNLVQYTARPAMSHAPGLSLLCIAIFLAVRRESSTGRLLALGALLGCAAIVRPSNVALAPFFAVLLWPVLGRSTRSWTLLLVGFAALIAVQLALNSALWGELKFSGYVGEGFTSGVSGIFATLFSARHGLFVYHPWYLVLLATCALALRATETRALAAGALASFALLAIINGTWWSWWFGDSFGNRAFIEILPALLVPSVLWVSRVVASALTRVRLQVAAVVMVFALLNGWLWGGFVLRRFPPDGQHTVAEAWLWWR